MPADNIYLIFTASNYFPDKDSKIEGNRYLAVYVNWSVVNNVLTPNIIFNNPLQNKGVDDVLPSLLEALSEIK